MNEAHPFGEAIAILDQPLDALDLSVRAHNALTGGYVDLAGKRYPPVARTVRDLVGKSAQELMREPGFGRLCLSVTRDALAAHGLYLRGEEPPRGPERASAPPVFSPLTLSHRLQVIELKLDLILSKLVPP